MRFTRDNHHTVREDVSKTQYDRQELDVCGRGAGETFCLPRISLTPLLP